MQHNTAAAEQYIIQHNTAIRWAEANRALIVKRFVDCLGNEAEKILDVNHNTVTPHNINNITHWIHRKGATPSTEGPVVIPGSRGSYSYLVQPTGSQESNAYSLAHGAGRKWKRSESKSKLSKYKEADFIKTKLGSRTHFRHDFYETNQMPTWAAIQAPMALA